MLYNVKKKTSSDEDWFSPNVEFKFVLLKYKKIIHQKRLIRIINPEMNFNRVCCIYPSQTHQLEARRIVPDFTNSVYGSSCNSPFFVAFFTYLIFLTTISYSIPSFCTLRMPINRKRRQRSMTEAEKAIITRTAVQEIEKY